MLQRRDFLRGLFGLGLSMGIPTAICKAKGSTPANGRDFIDPMKIKTLYTHFRNEPLEQILRQWADSNGCRIIPGTDPGTDVLVFSYFAAVVDRNLIAYDVWDFYVEWCNEGYETDVCIIVDDRTDLPMPLINPPIRMSLSNPNAPELICKKVDEAQLFARISLMSI